MASVEKLKIAQSDDQYYNLSFLDGNGTAIDISDWVVKFLVKRDLDDTDEEAVIQKLVGSGQSIDHSDPTNGATIIHIDDSDTDLETGNYYYYFILDRSGDLTTFLSGILTVRAGSVSTSEDLVITLEDAQPINITLQGYSLATTAGTINVQESDGTPALEQVATLMFDSSKFIVTDAGGGVAQIGLVGGAIENLNDIGDVNAGTPSATDLLQYDGTSWANVSIESLDSRYYTETEVDNLLLEKLAGSYDSVLNMFLISN